MLESCRSLQDCEKMLQSSIEEISLIGQIALSEEDVYKLTELIREKIRANIKDGIWELRNLFPTCLSCFLVWKGRDEYKEGNFWSSIWESLNLSKNSNLQGEWGRTFIQFLKRNGLPLFDIEDARRYVSPILIHGGIPSYCLNDFFQNLLIPIVSGRLEVDLNNTNEIINEWKDSSLFDRTDKPVHRFLLYGQEVAKDFLDRCIEMAKKAYYEEDEILSYDELNLPEGVVKHFQNWWDSYRVEKPPPEKGATRFRRPIIALNVGLGEIQAKIPPQRVDKSEPKEATIEILMDNNMFFQNRLKVYRRGKLFETSEIQLSLNKPAEIYEIRLLWDNDVIRVWRFKGLTQEKPWLAFLPDSNKLIEDKTLLASAVWFVIPKDCSFEPDLPYIEEESSLYGNWRNYGCIFVDLSSTDNLYLVSTRQAGRIPIPISIDRGPESKLVGGVIVNSITSEDKPVYIGRPPDIQIPITNPLNPEIEIQRWRLSIIPQGETSIGNRPKSVNLTEFAEVTKGQASFHISLSDERLLGVNPIGSFLVRLRGRLGKDRMFNLCLIPSLDINFDKKIYLPDEKGNISSAEVTISTLLDAEIRVEEPCRIISNDRVGRVAITIPATEASSNCIWSYKLTSGEISIPLIIQIPRLSWLVRGLVGKSQHEWSMIPQEINLSDWEDSDELELLIQVPLTEGHKIILELKNSDKIETKYLRKGVVRFDLKRFSDELRRVGQALSCFNLRIELSNVTLKEIPVLYVRTQWIVEKVEIIDQRVEKGERILHLFWKDKGKVKNRILRLWNLWSPWKTALERQLPDEASEVTLKYPVSVFPPGEYTIEFTLKDPWQPKPIPEIVLDTDDKNLFDFFIGSQIEHEKYRGSLGESFDEKLTKLSINILTNNISEVFFPSSLTDNHVYSLVKLLLYLISTRHDGNKLIKDIWGGILGVVDNTQRLKTQVLKVVTNIKSNTSYAIQNNLTDLLIILELCDPELHFKIGDMVYHEKYGIGCFRGITNVPIQQGRYLKIKLRSRKHLTEEGVMPGQKEKRCLRITNSEGLFHLPLEDYKKLRIIDNPSYELKPLTGTVGRGKRNEPRPN